MARPDARGGALSGKVVRRLGVFLEQRGHDARPFFDRYGISLAALEAGHARVPYSVVAEMGLDAAALTGVPNIGLDLALTVVEPIGLDVAGWMIMASATVRDALARATRHQRYWGDGERMALVPVEGGLAVRVSHPAGSPAEQRHDDECALAEIVIGLRFTTGADPRPRRVRFRHPRPDDTRQHDAIFRAPIEFDADRTELVLDDATLELPMSHAHDVYCAMFEQEVERALASLPETRRFSSEVKAAARAALVDQACTLARTARAMGIGARTLQRRLRDEGTSFDAIVDAVRREMAQSFLERGVPRKEIAMLLGYSEPSAFHRALRRWGVRSSAPGLARRDGAQGHRDGASGH